MTSQQTPELRRKYSQDQIDFLLEARLTHAMEYREVAEAFQERFGGSRTAEQMRHAFRSYATTATVDDDGEVKPHPLKGFTHSDFAGIVKSSGKERGRAFVTAASPVTNLSATRFKKGHQYGQNLYEPGFKAIKTWMKAKKGELVILPMRAHMPALHGQPSYYDDRLHMHQDKFANEYIFNDNLKALDVHLNPQQQYPLTGLYRIRGGRPQVIVDGRVLPTRFNQTLIFAAAKQDAEPVATGNGTLARYLYSTGAITLPEYLPNRVGRIAKDGHILGGLIVEWDGDKFWVRQVQFASDGSFCDVDGKRYGADGKVSTARAKALRMGDIHAGMELQDIIDAQGRLADVIQPEELYIEDVFDGGSVSHHTETDRIYRAMRKNPFRALQDEFDYCAKLLKVFKSRFKARIVIVDSNHHEHYTKYLRQGRYIKDDVNFDLAHRLVVEILDGIDPLRKRLDPDNDFEWLDTETDRYVEGCQMACHGHLGVDGARGSPTHLERTFGNAMVGHIHSGRILGKLMVVGHSSIPRHGYNRGASRWNHCPGVIYEGGQKQLVMIIDGRYCMDDRIAA